MKRGVDGEMPHNPVGVLELIGCAQMRMIRDSKNKGTELKNQSCMTTSGKMAGLVERMMREERKMDFEIKEFSRMDARSPSWTG